MAITLQLTDGLTTVDFNDGVTLLLADAFQMNAARSGAVAELIIAAWVDDVDGDLKASTMAALGQLIRKAARNYTHHRINEAVWLVWKPDDQTKLQYCRVIGGGVPEIDTQTIGGRGNGVFAPEILREALWWSVPPNGSDGLEVVASTTVYNKKDADGDNWIDIVRRPGDAMSMLQLSIDPSTDFDDVIIAKRIGDSATDLDSFNPWFNVADDGSSSITGTADVADTAAAGDLRHELTAGNSTVVWTISNPNIYRGRFHVYAIAFRNGGTAGTATATIGTPIATNDAVSLPTSNTRVYLGTISIPGVPLWPFDNSATNYNLTLSVTVSGADTFYVYGIWLVPADEAVYHATVGVDLTTIPSSTLEVDAAYSASYASASGSPYYTGNVIPEGEYPMAEPGRVVRLYFYFMEGTTHAHNYTAAVAVRAIDRYETMRGAA